MINGGAIPLPTPPPPPKRITMAGNLTICLSDLAGKSIACLGTTGSGKSTTARKLVEQCLEQGYPFTVADTEDEYYGLKEIGEVILAGPKDHGTAKVDVVLSNEKQCFALAKRAYLERRSVVLLLADLDEDTRNLFLTAYETGLFEAGRDVETRTPHLLVLEEAHEYVPQTGMAKTDPLFVATVRLAKRGRKRGIALMLVSQRPSNVNKDVLTQCQIFFCHWVSYTTDINTYKAIIPGDDLEARIARMQPGDVFYKHGKTLLETRIALPRTKSPSSTPGASPDPEKFYELRDTEELRLELEAEKGLGGIVAVDATEYNELKERCSWLEQENRKLESRVTTQLVQSGERTLQDLQEQLQRERARADRAEADAISHQILMQSNLSRKKG